MITRIKVQDRISFSVARDILSDQDEVFLNYEWEQDGSVGRAEFDCERKQVDTEAAVDYIDHLKSLEVDSARYSEAPEGLPAVPCESPIDIEAVFNYCQEGIEDDGDLSYRIAVYGVRQEIEPDSPVMILDLNGSIGDLAPA